MKYIKPTVELFSDMPAAGGCGDSYQFCGANGNMRSGAGCGDSMQFCGMQGAYK